MAAGLILSRLTYLMPLWGSSTDNYIRKVQSVWNKTARWTTNMSRRTRVRDLMAANKWMTIREMISFHSIVFMKKMIMNRKP